MFNRLLYCGWWPYENLHVLVQVSALLFIFFPTACERSLLTWKISSLWDSKEWSFNFKFRRSHRATVWEK